MKLSSLMGSLSSDALARYCTVYIVSKTYHPLSIASLLSFVQQKGVNSFVHVGTLEDNPTIEHQLAMLFLGQQQWFWVGSLEQLSPQRRSYWLKYLNQYKGPHSIWCHVHEPVPVDESSFIITLPETVDYDEFVALGSLLFSDLPSKKYSLFQPIFNDRKTISLDVAYSILHYVRIVSVQDISEFIHEWVDVLVTPEHSLFTLSTLFFAKDTVQFYQLWASLKKIYSVHFWVTYWSEQLFRASLYIAAKQANDMQNAKKYAYRLPFSFIQRDWKKYTFQELRNAHQRLYDLDYRLKQGGDERFLDLWIHQSLKS